MLGGEALKNPFLIIMFIFAMLVVAYVTPVNADNDFSFDFGETTSQNNEKEGEDTLAAENERFSLTVNTGNGTFSVYDKQTSKKWDSNPANWQEDTVANGLFKTDLHSQLLFYCYDSATDQMSNLNSYNSAVKKGGIDVRMTESGFVTEYDLKAEGIKIKLNVSLTRDGIIASVPTASIQETGSFRIYEMKLLPLFGAAGAGQDGFLFVPEGRGGIIDYGQRAVKDTYYRKIYGEDAGLTNRIDQTASQAYLPVFGVGQSGGGFLGIVTKGDESGAVNASVRGQDNDYCTVYPSFSIRKYKKYSVGASYAQKEMSIFQKETILFPECLVYYRFLDVGDSGYSDMARSYGDYLKGNHDIKSKTSPVAVVELLGAATKTKSFAGIPLTAVEPLTTFDECQKIADELKSTGAGNISFILNGITNSATKGKLEVKFGVSKKLGSKKQLISFIDGQKSENRDVYIEYEPIVFKNNGIGVFFNASKEILGQILKIKKWHPGIGDFDKDAPANNLLKPGKLVANGEKYLKSLEGLDSGIMYDYLSRGLYTDFSSKSTGIAQTRENIQHILQLSADRGKVASRGSNAYAAVYSDLIVDLQYKTGAMGIVTKQIPFYEIAMSGLVPYSYTSINMDGNQTLNFLRAVETGAALKYSFVYRSAEKLIDSSKSDWYAADYGFFKDTFVSRYKELEKLRELTNGVRIAAHSETAAGIFETVYENGVRTVVDYNTESYVIEGAGE